MEEIIGASPVKIGTSLSYLVLLILALNSGLVLANEAAAGALSSEKNRSERSLSQIDIIGNTELPAEEINLPWRLPSIEKRNVTKPNFELKGVLNPIDPDAFKRDIHFFKHLELDGVRFKRRR
jgi:hypothetical protein